jgi:hypothetical protein
MVSSLETLRANGRHWRELLVFTACVATGIAGATLFDPLVDAEHGLAFVLGALVFAFGRDIVRRGEEARLDSGSRLRGP